MPFACSGGLRRDAPVRALRPTVAPARFNRESRLECLVGRKGRSHRVHSHRTATDRSARARTPIGPIRRWMRAPRAGGRAGGRNGRLYYSSTRTGQYRTACARASHIPLMCRPVRARTCGTPSRARRLKPTGLGFTHTDIYMHICIHTRIYEYMHTCTHAHVNISTYRYAEPSGGYTGGSALSFGSASTAQAPTPRAAIMVHSHAQTPKTVLALCGNPRKALL